MSRIIQTQLGSEPVNTLLSDAPAFPPGVRLEWNGLGVGGYRAFPKDKKGGDISEWPEDLQIRQMPEVTR